MKESILIDWVVISNNWHRRKLTYICTIFLLNVAGFFYYYYYLKGNGYLPSPFIYDKSNTFMDLFNVLYGAYDDGRYTDWGSVYPPIVFLLLRFVNFVFSGGGYGDPAIMRDNSQFVILSLCLFYFAVPAIILKTKPWQVFPRIEKIVIYFLIILSSPLLFTLERGNVILLTPIFMAFVLSKNNITRSVCIALLINFKPYFVLLMIYYIARKNWKGFATCVLLSGLIFAVSGLVLDNHFLGFFANIFDFSQKEGLFSLREVMALPSSISAFSYVLKNQDGAMFVSGFLSSSYIEIIVYFIEIAKWGILSISLAILFVRSSLMSDVEIFILLVVAISNLDIWVGGYTLILYIVLVPYIIKMRARLLYIGILSLMAIPLDIVPLTHGFIGEQYSYLADAYVNIQWTLGLGSVVRPLANFFLIILLSFEFFDKKNKGTNNNIVHHTELFSGGCGYGEEVKP